MFMKHPKINKNVAKKQQEKSRHGPNLSGTERNTILTRQQVCTLSGLLQEEKRLSANLTMGRGDGVK